MTKFVILTGENGSVAVNPAAIAFIEKWSGCKCAVCFIGGEKLPIKEDYRVVCDKLIKGDGFVAND